MEIELKKNKYVSHLQIKRLKELCVTVIGINFFYKTQRSCKIYYIIGLHADKMILAYNHICWNLVNASLFFSVYIMPSTGVASSLEKISVVPAGADTMTETV